MRDQQININRVNDNIEDHDNRMTKRKSNIIFALILLPQLVIAQNKNTYEFEIIGMVDQINSVPVSISFQNNLEINNNGGHLQGVQYYKHKQNDYYFLSGSSDSYSYYVVVKVGNKNSVISINKILDKPFKHAGGFQIYKNLMAIGIEDNSGRKKSKVFVYQINDPENTLKQPLKIIERNGAYERATAGCVGIIEIKDYVLVVVGDWDTNHLDFYRIKKEKLFSNDGTFKLVYSIDAVKLDKSEWVDKKWLSYQNINLLKDSEDHIYLAGMASNDDENVLDLFRIETEDYSTFKLRNIHTRRFAQNEDSKFNWGAGVYISDDNQLKIFSCGAHIHEELEIYIYE